MDYYRCLDLRGMGVSDRVPLRLPLLEMFVPLKARREAPLGETPDRESRELRLAGRRPGAEEIEGMGERLGGPMPVLDLLKAHDGLILLGDPGAGKTTFLKFLALTFASGQGEALGLGARLPVLLPLAAYANALAEADVPLVRFIACYYQEERGVGVPLDEMLKVALEKGGVLFLLDGLDEVRERERRHLVVDRVRELYSLYRKKGNNFVLTSRIVGYREVRPEAEGSPKGCWSTSTTKRSSSSSTSGRRPWRRRRQGRRKSPRGKRSVSEESSWPPSTATAACGRSPRTLSCLPSSPS